MILLLLLVTLIPCGSAAFKLQMFSSDVNVRENCQAAIQKLSTLQETHPQLMAQFWDSWGKPSEGILYGHTAFLGYYDECMDLKNTAVGETSYCMYEMKMSFIATHNASRPVEDEVCYSSNCSQPIKDFNIQVGVCYPSACSPDEFASVLTAIDAISVTTHTHAIKLASTGDSPTFCPQTDIEYDTGTKIMFGICGIFIGLVIIGTGMDCIWWLLSSDDQTDKTSNKQFNTKPGPGEFITKFSLLKTVPDLFSMKQSTSSIKAVNSLKVLANLFIIPGHVYGYINMYYPQLDQNKTQYFSNFYSRMVNQPFANSTFYVDTFFIISATLSTYLTLKDIEKHKRFRFVNFYIGRFFRLAPLFYLAMFAHFKLLPHLSEGPLWYLPDLQACQSNWWRSLLFVNNVVSFDCICIAPSWHVSAEMQMFILSAIVIVTLYYSPLKGMIITGFCVATCTATVGIISIKNDFWAAMCAGPHFPDHVQTLHMNTVNRVSSYLVGIILGYILYKKYSIADLPITKSLQNKLCIILWAIALYFCKITLFGTIEEYNGTHHFTKWENATFLMFSGLAWSIGISIIIFLCNTGYGGVVNSVLSWPGWDPLVKLSYGVYLFHLTVIFFIVGSFQFSLIFTDMVFMMLCVFVIVASFGLSVVLTLTVELPVSKIVSLCFKLAGIESRAK